jgi:transposase
MIGSTRTLRVWADPAPADLRAGFDGLAGLVTQRLKQDPLSGHCFLFTNRVRTRAKVLVWDGTGLCIDQTRLEQGRFAPVWTRDATGPAVELTMSELALFLEGARGSSAGCRSRPRRSSRGRLARERITCKLAAMRHA